MKTKLIVIEGTDSSGKHTQILLLNDRLNKNNIATQNFSFPDYDSPTGKIIGGPFLGQPTICPEGSWFKEELFTIDARVSGVYYTIDRCYNIPKIEKALEDSHVILDRYIDSNLAYQAGKYRDKKKRFAMYKWFEKLEYGLCKLPKADIRILLYMPFQYSTKLKNLRQEKAADEYEKSESLLKVAERNYLELAKRNKYKIINCVQNGEILSREEINDAVYNYVISRLHR